MLASIAHTEDGVNRRSLSPWKGQGLIGHLHSGLRPFEGGGEKESSCCLSGDSGCFPAAVSFADGTSTEETVFLCVLGASAVRGVFSFGFD
jgi:hypothetical protein